MARLGDYLGLVRFSHTVFALPFALASALLAWADEPFRPIDLLGILLCMVAARTAAMAFNRLADRRLDAANPRTSGRHLPAGVVSPRQARALWLVSSGLFVAATGLFLLREPPNPWPLYLSGPVLVWICGYSLAKRFTSLAHYWLGAALALTPVAAWITVKGTEGLAAPGLFAAAIFFWVGGFDVIYACQDAEFDRRAGLHSLPARLGVRGALRVAAVSHLMTVLCLTAAAWASPHLRGVYLTGVGLTAALLCYEHLLVRPDDLARVNRAFFGVNAVISAGMLAAVGLQLLV